MLKTALIVSVLGLFVVPAWAGDVTPQAPSQPTVTYNFNQPRSQAPAQTPDAPDEMATTPFHVQNVEPAAGGDEYDDTPRPADTPAHTRLPLTTDEARGATY